MASQFCTYVKCLPNSPAALRDFHWERIPLPIQASLIQHMAMSQTQPLQNGLHEGGANIKSYLHIYTHITCEKKNNKTGVGNNAKATITKATT